MSGVGMPQMLLLNDFGSLLIDAFDGAQPYHVGSSCGWDPTVNPRPWRDVDVRLILSDEEYEDQGYGDPAHTHLNGKWRAMTLAFSMLGKQMTGLPIDFQIQQQSYANEKFKGLRAAIGIVPLRLYRRDSPA